MSQLKRSLKLYIVHLNPAQCTAVAEYNNFPASASSFKGPEPCYKPRLLINGESTKYDIILKIPFIYEFEFDKDSILIRFKEQDPFLFFKEVCVKQPCPELAVKSC